MMPVASYYLVYWKKDRRRPDGYRETEVALMLEFTISFIALLAEKQIYT
ncbi:hypothetical protein U3A58_13255 [Algoriphagus sp. C2-6-M1]|nr:hypothetical protein [Algoriphagus sp. C2-6-M1]MEB2781362.1 hypothetical protein [Algoriphagus sp. C2-6-M1]